MGRALNFAFTSAFCALPRVWAGGLPLGGRGGPVFPFWRLWGMMQIDWGAHAGPPDRDAPSGPPSGARGQATEG